VALDPYVYPGTSTLRNRYGVRDPTELARRETAASIVRLAELAARPIPGAYDLAHLQAFHRRIFGDVYDWAGEIRTVAIAKGTICSRSPSTSSPTSRVCSRISPTSSISEASIASSSSTA
jgi:fido (protein-threonine AMPylation protein)